VDTIGNGHRSLGLSYVLMQDAAAKYDRAEDYLGYQRDIHRGYLSAPISIEEEMVRQNINQGADSKKT